MTLISGCTPTCPTCCSVSVSKRPPERIPASLDWSSRLDVSGVWRLKSVKHVVKQASGASLAIAEYDASKTYVNADQISFGGALYTANDAVAAGISPATPNQTVWDDDEATTPHLYIPRDTDDAPEEWVERAAKRTTVILAGGADDTAYRVDATATFQNCDGRTVDLWDCIHVAVASCEVQA